MRKLRPGVSRAWRRLLWREEMSRLAYEFGLAVGAVLFRDTPLQKRIRGS